MPRTQFEMSTRIFGQWRNVIKQTVNRLSANAMSGLQALPSLSNAATATASSFPSATIRVCSVFNQHRRVRVISRATARGKMFQGHIYDCEELLKSEVRRWETLPTRLQFGQLATDVKCFKNATETVPWILWKLFFFAFRACTSWQCTGVTKKSVLGQHANITHCWTTTHTATPKEVSELISKVSGDGGSVAKDWNEEFITETQQKAQCYFMDPFIGDLKVPNYCQIIPYIFFYKKRGGDHCNHYVIVYTLPERLE